MKVLISAYHNPDFPTVTEYVESAFTAVGHQLTVFDDRQHVIPGRIRQRNRWLHELDLRHINKKMLTLALKTNPDLAIVTGGQRIKPQTIEALKKNGICTVLWTTDAPVDFQPIIDAAGSYRHIFCQGTEAVELLERAGIKGAQWLPMACDPDVHSPVKLSEDEKGHYGSDVVFVGSYYPNRAEVFEYLTDIDFGIWGPGWNRLHSKSSLRRCVKGEHVKPEQWLKIYSASKIVLATHYRDPGNRFPVYQASPRVFEALACGAFVISDKQRDVLALFKDGEHLVCFDDLHDFVERIRYYLGHPDERGKIAHQGRREVLKNHTYIRRIQRLISIVRSNSCKEV